MTSAPRSAPVASLERRFYAFALDRAIAWSLAGLAFALYTTANLAPRAVDHHKWYRDTFPDYPTDRRALVPHVL